MAEKNGELMSQQYEDAAMMPWDDTVEDSMGGGRPPLIKIAYPGTKDTPYGCDIGQFFNTATGEVFNEHDQLIWLASKTGCAMFHEPFDPDEPLLCGSNDGLVPSGFETHSDPQPGPCRHKDPQTHKWTDVCPKLAWGANREKPRCSTTYAVLFWDMGTESCVILNIKSRAITSLRSLKDFFRYRWKELRDKDHPELLPNLRFRVKMTKEQFDKPSKHWVPKFTVLTDSAIDPAYSLDLQQKLMTMKHEFKTTSVDDIVQTDQNGGGSDEFDKF